MTAPIALRTGARLCLVSIGLALMLLAAPRSTRADDAAPAADSKPSSDATNPAAQPAKPARLVEALAGKLVRKREKKYQREQNDLLNKIDLTKDVFYATDDSPVPEEQQFRFDDARLRSPEKGDARLRLPVEVPKYYHLWLDLVSNNDQPDASIGIVATMDGHPFFLSLHRETVTFNRFYGQEITQRLAQRTLAPDSDTARGALELLVGEGGILVRQLSGFAEWVVPTAALSLDQRWSASEENKIFLTFPEGQFDVTSITFEPLSKDEWLKRAALFISDGAIVGSARAEKLSINAQLDPMPEKLADLWAAVVLAARRGKFDELEQMADKLRKDEVIVENRFASEEVYGALSRVYVTPTPQGTHGELDGAFQAQLAFVDAWLRQVPDSVAARIVKSHVYRDYAWDARGGGFANKVPADAWKPFQERLETALAVLDEAARLKPRDVCVFSAMLDAGKGLGWSRAQMEKAVERGLQVSKKDFVMIDMMVHSLLPRWGGEPGDLGKFAAQLEKRVGGDDGLDLYVRVARTTQGAEVRLKRGWQNQAEFARTHRDFTNPAVVLEEFDADKLRAAIPVVRKRHPKGRPTMNYICFVCCALDERETAKEMFAELIDQFDVDIWGSRDTFDTWRHWADPAVPEPSQFLAPEGEEIAHLQAYSQDKVSIDFQLDNRTLITASQPRGSALKFWDLRHKKITLQFEPPENLGSALYVWMLDDGQLLVPMIDGRRFTIVDYLPPSFQMMYPANLLGLPYNLISDDGLTAGIRAPKEAVFLDGRQRKQNRIALPPIKDDAISSAGKYYAGAGDKIYLWESMTGKQVATIDVQAKTIGFLRDDSGIVYSTADKLAVWDIATGRERFSLPLTADRAVEQIRSTLGGEFLIVAQKQPAGDGKPERHVIAVYDLKKTEPIHVFDGHKSEIRELSVTRDGARLASSTGDGVVKVWDLAAATQAAKP